MRLMAMNTLGKYLDEETESAQPERCEGVSSGLMYGDSAVAFGFVLASFEFPSVFASSEVEALDSSGATSAALSSSCCIQH